MRRTIMRFIAICQTAIFRAATVRERLPLASRNKCLEKRHRLALLFNHVVKGGRHLLALP